MEPYRVRRAIFIAAGIGERLLPITLNTPKPLDWCFEVTDGVIVNQKIGGDDYWDSASAAKLQRDLQAAFDLPDGHEKYWDEVPLKISRKII